MMRGARAMEIWWNRLTWWEKLGHCTGIVGMAMTIAVLLPEVAALLIALPLLLIGIVTSLRGASRSLRHVTDSSEKGP